MDTTVEVFALKDALWKLTTRVSIIENFITNKFGASAISVLQQQLCGDQQQHVPKPEVNTKVKPMPASLKAKASVKRKTESYASTSQAGNKTSRLSLPVNIKGVDSNDEGTLSDTQNSSKGPKKKTGTSQIKSSHNTRNSSSLSDNKRTRDTRSSRINYTEKDSSDDEEASSNATNIKSTPHLATTIKAEGDDAAISDEAEDYNNDDYVAFSPDANVDLDDHPQSNQPNQPKQRVKKVDHDKKVSPVLIKDVDKAPLDIDVDKILCGESFEDEIVDGMICLGNDTFVQASEVKTVKALSNTPTIFARNLMRVLFSEEELLGKSLFGKKCNANLDLEALPGLDPRRRDAIIMYSALQFGYKCTDINKKKVPILREIKRTMGDYLRELTARRAQKNQ